MLLFMRCTSCNVDLGSRSKAAIAVMVAGDEVIHSYFYCPFCELWSIEHYQDHFISGDTDIWSSGPFDPEVGERCVALVRSCPEPQSKLCNCESHRLLYRGTPP